MGNHPHRRRPAASVRSRDRRGFLPTHLVTLPVIDDPRPPSAAGRRRVSLRTDCVPTGQNQAARAITEPEPRTPKPLV